MLKSPPQNVASSASTDARVEALLQVPVRDVASSPDLHSRIMADAERIACEPKSSGRLLTMPRLAVALAAAAALVLVLRPVGPAPVPGPSPMVSVSGSEAVAFLSAPVREMTYTPYEQEMARLRNDVMGAMAFAGSVVPSP